MSQYFTGCVHCGSAPNEAQLEVVTADVTYTKVSLLPDGFDWARAETTAHANEQVYCAVCDETHPLTDFVRGWPWTLEIGDDVIYDIGEGPVQVTIAEIHFFEEGIAASQMYLKPDSADGFNLTTDQLTEVV